MLKRSLDRLKSMRERISPAEAGISYCTLEINFNKDAYIVRVMCLDGQLGAALSLWWNMIQNSIVPDVITHNYLINGLCKNGELEKAEWIVRGMLYRGPSPTCAAYNSLIRGYCLMNDVDKALNTFSTMANQGIIPNRVTCNILVHVLCKKGLLEEAKNLFHKFLSKKNYGRSSDLITSTIMMDGCFKNFRSRSVVPITAAVFVSWRLDASVSHVMKLLSTEPATQKLAFALEYGNGNP